MAVQNLSKKGFLVSALAICVQYYHYHLYGLLAANIGATFFASSDPASRLLKTYALMFIAMTAKPFGALILSKIGDSKGRSHSFALSLIITCIASLILALTPSYEVIGILASVILLLYRLAISASVSPGTDGVRLYIFEHIKKSSKCLGVASSALFSYAGTFIASISVMIFTSEDMAYYSWRYAFIVGSALNLLVMFCIKKTGLHEKEIENLNKDKESQGQADETIPSIIKNNLRLFILSTILIGCIGSTNQFLIVFFGTYNYEILKIIDQSLMKKLITLAIICYMIFSIILSIIADRIGLFLVSCTSFILLIISVIILIFSINNGSTGEVFYVSIACFLPGLIMPAATVLKDSIPKEIRYRIFAISHSVGSILISAPTAYLMTKIYSLTKISWLPILYFLIVIIMILWSMYKIKSLEKR